MNISLTDIVLHYFVKVNAFHVFAQTDEFKSFYKQINHIYWLGCEVLMCNLTFYFSWILRIIKCYLGYYIKIRQDKFKYVYSYILFKLIIFFCLSHKTIVLVYVHGFIFSYLLSALYYINLYLYAYIFICLKTAHFDGIPN